MRHKSTQRATIIEDQEKKEKERMNLLSVTDKSQHDSDEEDMCGWRERGKDHVKTANDRDR